MPGTDFGTGHTFEHEGNEMKKVLLTSTALVMTAGIAFAEVSPGVSISGSAELGIKDEDQGADLQFHNDLDLDINFSGETDGGLAFGASIDLDEVNQGISADEGPAAAFISYNGWKLEMGDVDGALDLVNLETTFFTSINDDHTAHAGFFAGDSMDGGLDGQIATISYTGVPGLLLAASAELGDSTDGDDEIFAVGIRYTADVGAVELSGSLAWQDGFYEFGVTGAGATTTDIGLGAVPGAGVIDTLQGDAELYALSFEIESDMGLVGRLNYAELDGDFDTAVYSVDNATAAGVADPALVGQLGSSDVSAEISSTDVEWDFWGIAIGYETGPWAFEANYGEYDAEIGGIDAEADGFGLVANYDLGGGMSVQLGYGSGEGFFEDESTDTWSFGLGMSF